MNARLISREIRLEVFLFFFIYLHRWVHSQNPHLQPRWCSWLGLSTEHQTSWKFKRGELAIIRRHRLKSVLSTARHRAKFTTGWCELPQRKIKEWQSGIEESERIRIKERQREEYLLTWYLRFKESDAKTAFQCIQSADLFWFFFCKVPK